MLPFNKLRQVNEHYFYSNRSSFSFFLRFDTERFLLTVSGIICCFNWASGTERTVLEYDATTGQQYNRKLRIDLDYDIDKEVALKSAYRLRHSAHMKHKSPLV